MTKKKGGTRGGPELPPKKNEISSEEAELNKQTDWAVMQQFKLAELQQQQGMDVRAAIRSHCHMLGAMAASVYEDTEEFQEFVVRCNQLITASAAKMTLHAKDIEKVVEQAQIIEQQSE